MEMARIDMAAGEVDTIPVSSEVATRPVKNAGTGFANRNDAGTAHFELVIVGKAIHDIANAQIFRFDHLKPMVMFHA